MRYRQQSGFVLVLTLVILTALTLVSIPAMRASNVNMKVVSNEASQELLRNRVQRVIEQSVSNVSGTIYTDPSANKIVIDGQTVAVSKPKCVDTKVASGYSVDDDIPPEDVVWEVTANAEGASGSRITILQGVKIRMLAGSCV
jgi:Tfp pilus assembly protein PilX